MYKRQFLKFYEDVFFPTLEKEGIDTIVDMGDTFDNRHGVNFSSLSWAKNNYYDRLRDYTIHTIIGNHTAYYKNTNKINSIYLLLREYDNVKVYSEVENVVLGDLNVLFVPWINSENRDKSLGVIKRSSAPVAMGHFELNGFKATHGHIMEHGMEASVMDKFEKVYSGHFHTRSDNGKIYYLGNPYEIFWNDCKDTRGFHIFDTETLEHTPVNNPYRLFYKIYYEDTPYQTFDVRKYENKIVKVIVRKKTKPKMFEKFLDKLYSVGVQELKIIENFDIQESEDFDVDEEENTISILNRYIDESEFDLDKNIIKGIFQDLYRQACEVE